MKLRHDSLFNKEPVSNLQRQVLGEISYNGESLSESETMDGISLCGHVKQRLTVSVPEFFS